MSRRNQTLELMACSNLTRGRCALYANYAATVPNSSNPSRVRQVRHSYGPGRGILRSRAQYTVSVERSCAVAV
jgi:hypothetical protein